MFKRIAIPLLALLVTLTGCSHESPVAPFGEYQTNDLLKLDEMSAAESADQDDLSLEATRELLARIDLDEGQVEFLLVDDSMILIASQIADRPDAQAPLASLGDEAAAMGASAIYEALAGEPAPRRLAEAQAKLEARDQFLAQSLGLQSPQEIPMSDAAKMSASAFTGLYCYSGGNFHECETEQTINQTFNYDCWYMYFVVNTVSGRVGQKLRYEKNGSYITAYHVSVPAGTISEVSITHFWCLLFVNRNTRAIVKNVDGNDEYHVALWGLT